MTHRVFPLLEGVSSEQALGDALDELMRAVDNLRVTKVCERSWGKGGVGTVPLVPYAEALERAEERLRQAEYAASRALYSTGRWRNPPC